MALKTRPLATFPWIPKKDDQNLLLGVFSEELFGDDNEMQSKIEICKIINKSFPYYIPTLHHRMSARKMTENYQDGRYWGAAIYYTLSTKGFGSTHWDLYQNQYDTKTFNETNNPFISKSMKSILLPEPILQCTDAAEFLLEPWVLVQLPLQADLLHQWLVAALFQAIDFEVEISEFFFVRFPDTKEITKAANCLQLTFKNVQETIAAGFKLLQTFVNCCMPSRKEINTFLRNLEYVLRFLHFWLKSNGRDTVRALKKICYNEARGKALTKLDKHDYLAKLGVYKLRWWRDVPLDDNEKGMNSNFLFYCVKNKEERTDMNADGIGCRGEKPQEHISEIELPYFKEFLTNCCGLKNSNNFNLDDTTRNSELLSHNTLIQNFRDCIQHSYISVCLSKGEDEQGIIGSVLEAEMRLRVKDTANILREFFLNQSEDNCLPQNVFNEDLYLLPDMKLKDITGLLEKMNRSWFDMSVRHKLLTDLKVVGNASGNLAEILENKIKDLVLQNIEEFHSGKRALFDWHFAQYMLPCFVAFCYDLESNVDNEKFVEWYFKLVEELISTYNQEEFTLMTNVKAKIGSNLALFVKYYHSLPSLLLSYMRKICTALTGIFSRDKSVKKLSKFPLFLSFYEALEYSNRNKWSANVMIGEKVHNATNAHWDVLTFDFFSRIETAMSNTLTVPYQFNQIIKWTPNMADLIRTIYILGRTDEVEWLPYMTLTSSANLLRDILMLESDDPNLATFLEAEIGTLTEEQILGITFYLAMNKITLENVLGKLQAIDGANGKSLMPSCGDVDIAFHSYLTDENMTRLKEFHAINLEEKYRVTRQFAENNAPVCYEMALLYISSGNLLTNEDAWYFPIKSCRGCKSFDELQGDFFCSEKCKKAYEKDGAAVDKENS